MAALALHVSQLATLSPISSQQTRVLKVTTDCTLPEPLRHNRALLFSADVDAPPEGFSLYLSRSSLGLHAPAHDCLYMDGRLDYLADGDVIRFEPEHRAIKALWRRSASSNAFLLTERCNSFCLMCSQPPRDVEDSFLLDEVLDAIPLIDPDAKEIAITGGEPALYGQRLVGLVHTLKLALPRTAVHVLTNGRLFEEEQLAMALGAVKHPDLMLGIPIYSQVPSIHDFVVQAKGAFDETIRGIVKLKESGVRVEIRVVIHKQTAPTLAGLADFIARNLLFVDHVALMGLEVTGFTRANLGALHIDASEYSVALEQAAMTLDRAGLWVSIYNHPLCAIPEATWKWSVRSISDWKNEFNPVCATCRVRHECGGLFATSRGASNFSPTPFV